MCQMYWISSFAEWSSVQDYFTNGSWNEIMASSLLRHSMIEHKCSICLTFFQWVVSHQVHLVDLFCCPVLEPDMRQGGKKSWLMFSTASYYHDQTAGALSCSFGRFPLITFTQWCWVTTKRGLIFASMTHWTPKTQFNNVASNVHTHWW